MGKLQSFLFIAGIVPGRTKYVPQHCTFNLKRGCNGNRKFSCFWCKMKEFFVSTKCTILTNKFQLLFEILSFEKTADFRSKNYFLTSGKATMT